MIHSWKTTTHTYYNTIQVCQPTTPHNIIIIIIGKYFNKCMLSTPLFDPLFITKVFLVDDQTTVYFLKNK